MKRNRVWRRKQKRRYLKRTENMMLNAWWWNPLFQTKESVKKMARYIVKNRKKCSQDCCCNPRHNHCSTKKEKLTMQERKLFTIEESKD